MFIGRQAELKQLKQLHQRRIPSFVVIQGRRRIGKSRLVEEFVRQLPKGTAYFRCIGLAPTQGITAQDQRDEFCAQMAEQMGFTNLKLMDWGDIFTFLAKQTTHGKTVIFFDEISWMGSKDPTFLPKLKNAWDVQFSKNPNLMLIVCGSVSSWIEKNIVSSTAFLGRPSLYMHLDELPLEDCNRFWDYQGRGVSDYEKLKILSVTGGVPRYLELMDPSISAEENIRRLCFVKNAPLTHEFDRIFSDIFGIRSEIYKKIITLLSRGKASLTDILTFCERSKTGDFSEYLKDLVVAGFVARDYSWNIRTKSPLKLSHFRLKDNYTRFYLKFVQSRVLDIEKGLFQKYALGTLPGWDGLLGIQFENLVLNNQLKILDLLGIPYEEILFANPYFQRGNKTTAGCQIDFMIQTRFNTVHICEIKFKNSPIDSSIIQEIKEKIKALSLPKNYTYRPVLIHVNGVHQDVAHSGFFSSIIDFGQFLRGE